MQYLPRILSAALAAAACAAACANTSSSSTPGGSGGLVGSDGGLAGGADGSFFASGDASAASSPLAIAPVAPTVTVVSGQPASAIQFTATVGGQDAEAAWSIDRTDLGTLDAYGRFTPSGALGGTANIAAVAGTQRATTTITVALQIVQQGDPAWSANPAPPGAGGYGGVGGDGPGAPPSSAQLAALAGTPAPDAFRLVDLPLRRHRVAPGPARAAAAVALRRPQVRLGLAPHSREELRLHGVVRG